MERLYEKREHGNGMSDTFRFITVDQKNQLHQEIVEHFGFSPSDWTEEDLQTREPVASTDRFTVTTPEYYLGKVRRRIEDMMRKNPWLTITVSQALNS